MASFVFNNFKKRFISGGIPSADTWKFIPVNSSFKDTFEHDDVTLSYYRTIEDFKNTNSSVFNYNDTTAFGGTSLLRGAKLTRHWTKVLDDSDTENKPMFITEDNFDSFIQYYNYAISSNPNISNYISSGGFYFIRSKDELTWFADRANTGNNKIIGILGDDIEGVINNEPIGKNENYPFEGIFDGNGYKLRNFSIYCSNIDNGLVGVLGYNGIVRNIEIASDGSVNNLICNKLLNLNHIKKDARDINAGCIVGKNYGTIENIDAYNMNYFKISGFVPEVYSVTNKSDNYTWSDGFVREKYDAGNENYYYLNSFCINSPGNICPYVGYFAEGYWGEQPYSWLRMVNEIKDNKTTSYMAEYNGGVLFNRDYNSKYTLNNIGSVNQILGLKDVTYTTSGGETVTAENVLTALHLKMWNDFHYNPSGSYVLGMWDDDINSTNKNISGQYTNLEMSGVFLNMAKYIAKTPVYYFVDYDGNYTSCVGDSDSKAFCPMLYNTNLLIKQKGDGAGDFGNHNQYNYTQTSLRMHPQARVAYNIGLIAGANYGTIKQVSIKTIIQNTSNFVGFIGGIAGKQEQGLIDNCAVDINYNLIYDFGTHTSAGDAVIYKGTPVLSNSLKNKFNGYYLNSTYYTSSNLDILFSSFYDADESISTATDITDDCITYKLRPIFIAGGLFGRYIPSYNSSTSSKFGVEEYTTNRYIWGTQILNSTVVYNDNYNTTNNISGNYKRIENAFGVIAGKLDYETCNIGTNEDIISGYCTLQVTNSVFSANTNEDYISPTGNAVGEPIKISNDITNTNYYSKSKYFGVCELKYNELNSIAVLNHSPRETSNNYYGQDTNLSYALDYPWCARYDNTCFDKTYNMSDDENYEKMTVKRSGLTHQNCLPKDKLIPYLLKFNSCKSNIDPVFVYYADYWNYSAANPSVSSDSLASHGGEPRKCIMLSEDDTTELTNKKTPTRNGFCTTFGDGILLSDGIGVQNLYDGYTFVSSYYQSSLYYNGFLAPMSAWENYNTFTATEGEYWNDTTMTYHNPRIFVKNISAQFTPLWNPNNYSASDIIQTINSSMNNTSDLQSITDTDNVAVTENNINMDIGFNKNTEDNYFSYNYTTSAQIINPSALVSDSNTFNFNLPVHFTHFNDNRLGYCIYDERSGFSGDSGIMFNNNIISLGESICPTAIRQRIKDAIAINNNNSAGFDSSSVSANEDNDFAGLLVIDSSGNNVMYIENNGLPLTGNSWNYQCEAINNNGGLLLEVK